MQSTFKWRALSGLLLVFLSLVMNWQWLWGVLFIFWVIPDLMSGFTYFMEPVERKANPFVYWTIIITWIGLSVYMIGAHFYPEYFYSEYSTPYSSTQSMGEYQYEEEPYVNPFDSSMSYEAVKVGEGKLGGSSLPKQNSDAPKPTLNLSLIHI